MTASDFISRPYDYCGQQLVQLDADYVRRDPAVLAELPEVKALVTAAVMEALEGAVEGFMAEVWEALKADASDLNKQRRILSAFRALITPDAKAALQAYRDQEGSVAAKEDDLAALNMARDEGLAIRRAEG